MKIMLKKILIEIGLTPNEAVTYLACLRLGAQPASTIAKYANINRFAAYDSFKGLIKKGLSTKTIRNSVAYFQVLDPKNLVSYLECSENELIKEIKKKKIKIKEALPDFKSLENPARAKLKVQFFEGRKGVREAYEETLKSKEDLLVYTNNEASMKFYPDPPANFRKKRIALGLFSKCICPANKPMLEKKKTNKKELRDMRHVPHSHSFSPTVFIYEDKVLMISHCEQMAISIQSAELADFHKKMHDLLWNKLEK